MMSTFQRRLYRIDAGGAAACVATLAIGYFSAVRPYMSSEAGVRREREELAVLRAKEVQSSSEWRTSQKDLRDIERSIAAMPFTLRPVKQVNTHLAEVIELAKGSGLIVQDMSPGTPIPGRRSVTVPIKLRGTGGFPEATAFLNNLHARFVDTRVTAFLLQADIGAVSGTPSFSFELAWHAVPDDPAGSP